MKRKEITIILCLCAVTAFVSCTEKQYTCECGGGLSGGTSTASVIARSKLTANNRCKDIGNPPGTPDGIFCRLKTTKLLFVPLL